MPGCLKQVPQDSTEWDRTDTGHCTDGQTNTCDIDIDSCSEPSSNKLKKNIYILEVLYAFLLEFDSRSLYYDKMQMGKTEFGKLHLGKGNLVIWENPSWEIPFMESVFWKITVWEKEIL